MDILLLTYIFGAMVTALGCEYLDRMGVFEMVQLMVDQEIPKPLLKGLFTILWPIFLPIAASRKP